MFFGGPNSHKSYMSTKLGKFEFNKIYCGDCLKLLKDIPDNSIDLVIADPPFAIDFKGKRTNYHRTPGRVIEGYNEIPKEKYFDFSVQWMKESFRILKDSGSMYCFSGWTNLKEILMAIDEVGFKVINHLIWKYQFGVFTKRKFVTSHYHIPVCVKNEKKYKFNKNEHYPEDVIYIKREYWTGKVKTPNKLPVALVAKLIQFSTNEGDVVLDPFMGSGTTAVACKLLKRHFIGFEVVPEYVKLANRRLTGERLEVSKKLIKKEETRLLQLFKTPV